MERYVKLEEYEYDEYPPIVYPGVYFTYLGGGIPHFASGHDC